MYSSLAVAHPIRYCYLAVTAARPPDNRALRCQYEEACYPTLLLSPQNFEEDRGPMKDRPITLTAIGMAWPLRPSIRGIKGGARQPPQLIPVVSHFT